MMAIQAVALCGGRVGGAEIWTQTHGERSAPARRHFNAWHDANLHVRCMACVLPYAYHSASSSSEICVLTHVRWVKGGAENSKTA